MFTNVNTRKRKVKERKVLGDKTNIIYGKTRVEKPELLIIKEDFSNIRTRKAIENNPKTVSNKTPETQTSQTVKHLHNNRAHLARDKIKGPKTHILNNKSPQNLKNINSVCCDSNGFNIPTGPMKQLKVMLDCDKNHSFSHKIHKIVEKSNVEIAKEKDLKTQKLLLKKACNAKSRRGQRQSKKEQPNKQNEAEDNTHTPQSSGKAGKSCLHRKLTVLIEKSPENFQFGKEKTKSEEVKQKDGVFNLETAQIQKILTDIGPNVASKVSGQQVSPRLLTVVIERSPQCVNLDNTITTNMEIIRDKLIKENIVEQKQTPKRQLTVLLERSPERSPEFLGFPPEHFDDFSGTVTSHKMSNSISFKSPLQLLSINQNGETNCPFLSFTPRSCRMVQDSTPRTLKVILERINLQKTSPDFLGFENSDKKTISPLKFTPKSLQIILTKIKSTDLFIQNANSKKDCNLEIIENNKIKKTTTNIQNRILQVSLKKHVKGRKLITQLDGISHSSEISLENDILEKTQQDKNLFLHESSFEGFEKEMSGSPSLLQVLENSVQEMEEYISMLAEESLESIERVAKHNNIHKGNKINKGTNKRHKTVTGIQSNNKEQNTITKVDNLSKVAKNISNTVNNKKQDFTRNRARYDKNSDVLVKATDPKSDIIETNKAQKAKRCVLLTDKNSEESHKLDKPLNLELMFKGFEPHEQSLHTQKVTFDLSHIEESVADNYLKLRRKPEKNYCEESVMDSSVKLINPVGSQRKVPVYKQIVPENKPIKSIDDEYEFTDISPKKTVKKNQLKRSSGFFDKDTHLVVKKLEKKEQLKKKRQIKKNTKQKAIVNPEKSGTYKKTVESIVSNVLKKVKLRKSLSPVKTITKNLQNKEVATKQNDHQVYSKDIKDTTQNNKIVVEAVVHTNVNIAQSVPSSLIDVQENKNDMVTSRRPQKVVVTQLEDKINVVVVPEQSQLQNEINSIVNVPEQPSVPEKSLDVVNKSLNIKTPNINGDNESILNESYNIQQVTYNDASIIQNDIDTCFGFKEAEEVNKQVIPQSSTPIVSKVNVISNVTLHQQASKFVDSPVNFQRPNANSTMLGCNFGLQTGSPWRLELKTLRQNPYFISVKNNTLPRLDQEMVLDHTLVDEFESHCSKNTSKLEETKKSPVQQSILNYIECDADILEKENLINPRPSLFDYEAFNSPVKINRRNDRVKNVKRKILEDSEDNRIDNVDTSVVDFTDQNDENVTYFGFDENSPVITKTKNPHVEKAPSRFDTNLLKKYKPKKKGLQEKQVKFTPVEDIPTVSILNVTNEDSEVGDRNGTEEMHLFADAEELFDDKPVEIRLKRTKRCRTVSVDDDDQTERKAKKHKKTQFEIDQENWIKSFNKELEEVEKFDLETE